MTGPHIAPRPWVLRTRTLTPDGRALIMGVLNVTPDSFSDGGLHRDAAGAVRHGLELVAAGADLVDVGGESTRPGAREVDLETEVARTIPVVAGLVSEGVAVSIDTSKPGVVAAALKAGAEVVNDVTGFRSAEMRRLVAESGAGLVVIHMQGNPRSMQLSPKYTNVVDEVEAFLLDSAEQAVAAGVEPDHIAIDPGIGFGKSLDHNLVLLANTPRLASHGFPVLVGHSRKRFLGELTGIERPSERDGVTAVLSGVLGWLGASILRVHDVHATKDALLTAAAMVRFSTS